MGHLTYKMIGILIASLLMFGLAQAENRAEKSEGTDDVSRLKAKEEKAAERFRAQQSIQRALRDQGQAHGPIAPMPAPAPDPGKKK